ncbi:MAG: ABC transporter permease subunit [Pseudomonadota bacterium]
MTARWSGLIWIGCALALWELLDRSNPESILIAGPTAIAGYLIDNAVLMTRAILATGGSAAWGFLWGNIAAITLAIATILMPRAERSLAALALLVFCLPLVATGPILRVLYGPGAGPQITLAALAVYYTTYLALLVGLRAVPQSWSDLIRIYGRGRWTMLAQVRARASLPYLFVGLQIAAPAAFLGAMIGEFTGADRGMGVLTLRAMRGLESEATWALASVAAGLSIVAFWAFGKLGQALVGYAPVVLLSPPRSTTGARPRWMPFAEGLGIALIVLCAWYGVMEAFELNRFFAKRPGDVAMYLADMSNLQTLLAALMETLVLAIPGYLAGLLLGAVLAAALVMAPTLAQGILPFAVALRAVPIITTAPLLVLALGRGVTGTVTIVAVMIFFPTLVACLEGLRQTPAALLELFRSYGAGRWRLLLTAQIPAMLPAFFASARMAVPAALLAATTAEWLATGRGIGVLMALTSSTSDYNMLWSCVVVLSLVAAALYRAVARCERAVLRVYAAEQTA